MKPIKKITQKEKLYAYMAYKDAGDYNKPICWFFWNRFGLSAKDEENSEKPISYPTLRDKFSLENLPEIKEALKSKSGFSNFAYLTPFEREQFVKKQIELLSKQ